jgi:hypothetical protein
MLMMNAHLDQQLLRSRNLPLDHGVSECHKNQLKVLEGKNHSREHLHHAVTWEQEMLQIHQNQHLSSVNQLTE